MENDYKKQVCTAQALKFFLENIKYGHELDLQVDQSAVFQRGEIITYIPDSAKKNIDINLLEGGGIASRDKSINCIAAYIFEYLEKSENGICIFEDSTCTPDDNFPGDLLKYVYFYNEEVYCVLTNENLDLKLIIKAIREFEQPNYFLVVLAQIPTINKSFLLDRSLKKDDFKNITKAAEKIIISAYDGEGYLVWEKLVDVE